MAEKKRQITVWEIADERREQLHFETDYFLGI